jgi:hypothetical protein
VKDEAVPVDVPECEGEASPIAGFQYKDEAAPIAGSWRKARLYLLMFLNVRVRLGCTC